MVLCLGLLATILYYPNSGNRDFFQQAERFNPILKNSVSASEALVLVSPIAVENIPLKTFLPIPILILIYYRKTHSD